MLTWEDLQSWCDDLSNWVVEIGQDEDVKRAWPKGPFPFVVDPAQDDIENCKDILSFMTVWVCCKLKTRAPSYLESRIILSERFRGPWQDVYCKLVQRLENNLDFTDIDVYRMTA
jgi:hypothetical protein